MDRESSGQRRKVNTSVVVGRDHKVLATLFKTFHNWRETDPRMK